MIQFAWPWLWLLLPLPWLLRRLLPPAAAHGDAALRVPFLEDFSPSHGSPHQARPRRWPLWGAAMACAAC